MLKSVYTSIMIILSWAPFSLATIIVNVACSNFPPYYYVENGVCVKGKALEKIKQLNANQKNYEFRVFVTSPARKTVDFNQRKFDMSLYSNINWGWDKQEVFPSCVFANDYEVFITRKENTIVDPNFFDNISKKKIAAINGYHYGFANFNADKDYLRQNFDIELSNTHAGNIMAVILRRVDVAIVTKSFLDDWRAEHPDLAKELVESKKYDQTYQFTAVLRKNGPINQEEIDAILGCLH